MRPDTKIRALEALEILDSRGRPTLEVRITLEGGVSATAGVPLAPRRASTRRSRGATMTRLVTGARVC